MQSNMLSEEKVKLHGMRTRRWTDDHKVAQYKGIVKLYERDQVLIQRDVFLKTKEFKKDINEIRKNIRNEQENLSNSNQGDRQTIRNALVAHKNFLLTYQHFSANGIVEELFDRSFSLRREEDTVNYDIRKKTEQLIDLKLDSAKLEDTIIYEKEVPFPDDEVQTRILSSQVEEFGLKRDAAIMIQETYHKMLKILEKDAIYYNAVLAALQIDGHNQSKCIMRVIEMGQLASEYLDDKRKEIDFLEMAIKHNRAERKEVLNRMEQIVDNISSNLKNVTHKDSIIELEKGKSIASTESSTNLIRSVRTLRATLEKLRVASFATTVEDILPRLQEQQQQRLRLDELLVSTTEKRNTLRNKWKHGKVIYNELRSTMADTTFWYKLEKIRILDETQETKQSEEDADEEMIQRGKLIVILRAALQHLAELLRNIRTFSMATTSTMKKKEVTMEYDKPITLETDSEVLLDIVKGKLRVLMSKVDPETLDATIRRVAASLYQRFVCAMLGETLVCTLPPGEISLIDEINLEDPMVPNRNQVKAISDNICSKNAKSEFDVPVLTVKKA